MRSRMSFFHPRSKPFPSTASPMCRLLSSFTFPTLRHWSCFPSLRTIFVRRRTQAPTPTQNRWQKQLRRRWFKLIDVCGVSGVNMRNSRWFSSSSYISVIQKKSHRPIDLIYLPFMHSLRFLEIHLDFSSGTNRDFNVLSFLIGSLSMSLTSPEHLEFNLQFHGCNKFDPDTFYQNLRNVWKPLDLISIFPNSSRIQRVEVNINYAPYRIHDGGAEPDKDEILKAIRDGLSLFHTRDILFVKAVLGKWWRLN